MSLLLQSLLPLMKFNYFIGLCPIFIKPLGNQNYLFSVNRQSQKYSFLIILIVFVIFFLIGSYSLFIFYNKLFINEGPTNRITDTIYLNLVFYIYYATLFDAFRKSKSHATFLNRLRSIELELKQLFIDSSYPAVTFHVWIYILLAVILAFFSVCGTIYITRDIGQEYFIFQLFPVPIGIMAITNSFGDIYMTYLILLQVKLYVKINEMLMEVLTTDLACMNNCKKLRKSLCLLCNFTELPHLFANAFKTNLCIEIFRYFCLEIDSTFNCISNLFKHKITELFVVNLTRVPSLVFLVALTKSLELLQNKVRFLLVLFGFWKKCIKWDGGYD